MTKTEPIQDRGKAIPASRPTGAQPGSAEKLQVLIERAERGEHLWHPLDGNWLKDEPRLFE